MGLGPTPTPLFQPAAFPLAPSVQPLETRGSRKSGGGAEKDVIFRVPLGGRSPSMSRVIWQIGPQIAAKTATPANARERAGGVPLSSALMNI